MGSSTKRLEIIAEVARSRWAKRSLLISNIGYPSRELYSVYDGPNVFYMLGSMGLASSIGLGLSLVRKDMEVLVLDGDGSVLMNLGTLATIGSSAGPNFHLLIIDNHAYGSTGNQKSHTSMGVDLLSVAKAAGIKGAAKIREIGMLRHALKREKLPTVAVIACEPFNADVPIIPHSPARIRTRFMNFLSRSDNVAAPDGSCR